MTFKIGTVVLKLAGRDAGRVGVIIDLDKDNNVMIDGYVRRKRCNVKHLEPLEFIKIKKNEKTEDVKKALVAAGYKFKEKKKLSKSPGQKERPKKQKKVKKKVVKEKPKKEEKKVKETKKKDGEK